MIKHICDRCGMEMIPHEKSLGERIDEQLREMWGFKKEPKYEIRRANTDFITGKLDLCEACEKNLIEWMRGDKK